MEELQKLEENEDLKFAVDYFNQHNLKVVRFIDRTNTSKLFDFEFLAKDKRTGNNHTFVVVGGELRKLVHNPKTKFHPWNWKVVASRVSRKSYLEEMRAAVNGNRTEK